jgi:ATP-dependent RNA helicase RhlE
MTFNDFGLIQPLLHAVRSEGYVDPTPIQEQAIPHVLEGRDLLGCAQTGSGKTAAFALPILQRLYATRPQGEARRYIRALIVTPTRELAAQIGESFGAYGRLTGLRHTVIFGGVGQRPQEDSLKRGVDILVATPGRLLDLTNQGFVNLRHIEIFVLDEADRMLDMGFIQDIRRIISHLPAQRQTLFFSATMPPSIQHLADSILRDPVEVRVTPEAPTVDSVQQTVYFVERQDKMALLHHLLADPGIRRALVFTRTKHNADRVAMRLKGAGINAAAIHSNKSQNERTRTLENFKAGRTRVLVASDIAARGLDVDDISHVINFDMPNEPETYVHRIGRTARMGAVGMALSFCSGDERTNLDDIERLILKQVEAVEGHPFSSPLPMARQKKAAGAVATAAPRFMRRHRRGPRPLRRF